MSDAPGPFDVAIRGEFGGHHSLARCNDALAAALEARGRRVQRLALGAGATAAPGVPVVSHSWPPIFAPDGDGPLLLMLPWEFGHPLRAWVEPVRAGVDRLLVPVRYVGDGFVDGGMPPGVVEVVPYGVDVDLYAPSGPRRFERGDRCVFLFVGGTIARKGIDLLMRAWERAFGEDDPVVLVVKAHGGAGAYRGQNATDDIRRFAAEPGVAAIEIIDEELADDELPALYRSADALVHPYRGEGFGLPMLEAMACGVPVVHTAIGPSAEFVPPDGGWAVRAQRVTVGGSVSGMPLSGPGYQHQVDLDALVAALRAVAADPGDRARRGAAARAAAEGWTWDAAAARLEVVLAGLRTEGGAPARAVVPAELPEARAVRVLLAGPIDPSPGGPLDAWLRAVPPDADATLVLPVPAGRAEAQVAALGEALDARPAGPALPDLLALPWDAGPEGLVAAADAVLVADASTAAVGAIRRARRVLVPDDVAAFAAGLRRGAA